MRNLDRLIRLGFFLLGLAWIGYFQILAPWYRAQQIQLDQGLATGQMELTQLEGHLAQREELVGEVEALRLLVAGVARQLPAKEERVVLWERLESFAKSYAVQGLELSWIGEAEDVDDPALGVTRVALSYKSTYEESLRLLKGLGEQHQVQCVETFALDYGASGLEMDTVHTTLTLAIYYDAHQGSIHPQLDLPTLVGITQEGQGQPHVQRAPVPMWQVVQREEQEGIYTYEVTGKDLEGNGYSLLVQSREAPRVMGVRTDVVQYLVVETVEGERVQQWLGE